MAHLPASLASAWDRASPRERVLVRGMLLVVILAVLYAVAWQPLTADISRTRDALERDRAAYETLRAYAEPQAAPSAGTAPAAEPLAGVTRALDARSLRASASQLEAREGRVMLLLGAVRFDALVTLLDDLARVERVRTLDARITARVEPGVVRAELTLGR
jgi:type II secretory pathway component PulM